MKEKIIIDEQNGEKTFFWLGGANDYKIAICYKNSSTNSNICIQEVDL